MHTVGVGLQLRLKGRQGDASLPDKISWRRVLVEGLVIVVSILLAFGIEAWWQERGDRSAERDALVALHAEFTEIRERLQENTLFPGELAAVEALFERVQALPLEGGALSVPDTMLSRAVSGVTFESATPVLDGLISSGRLEFIQDQSVRVAVSEWQHWLTQLDEFEIEASTFTNMQLRPALVSRGDVASALATARSFGYVEIDPDGVTTLRVDQELKALLAARFSYAGGKKEIRDRLIIFANSLLIAIENAQDR